MHWTSICHNTVNVTFTPLPSLIVSVSDGNIGLPDINLTLRKEWSWHWAVCHFDKIFVLDFKSHRKTYKMKIIININIYWFTGSRVKNYTVTLFPNFIEHAKQFNYLSHLSYNFPQGSLKLNSLFIPNEY